MSPSLPRTALSSLARSKPSSHPLSLPIRSLSTTPSLAAIGPESPKFIEIPVAPQHDARPKIIIKGTLPVPREIFPNNGYSKTSERYLASATPESKNPKEPSNDYIAWKQRLAATRRQSLREGLVELKLRKTLQDAAIAYKSKNKSRTRERLLRAPQREDERLTNPTIKSATRALQSTLPDPNRAQRVAESIARTQAIQKQKEEARKDALHTLYMNARTFITTEKQLEDKVEEIFTDTPHGPNNKNQNIWEATQSPPTIVAMLNSAVDVNKQAILYGAGPAAKTVKRMKRIAEELTGGKMD